MSKGKQFGFPKKVYYSSIEEKKPKLGILSDNVMSYYRNVSSSLESGFDDEDDPSMKDNFLTNVYNTLKDEGVEVSQNQSVSRILEMLFSHSKPHHMRELFCKFCANLTIVMFDRFASHVFQSLIQHLPAVYEDIKGTNSTEGHQTSNVHASIDQLCKFTESHMRDIMVDTYASHVLRSLLEALGGVKVKEEVIRSRVSRIQSKEKSDSLTTAASYKSLSQDFKQSFKTLIEKIVHLCNFEDHLSDPSYCPVLQTVLLIQHKISPKEYDDLVKKIFEKTCTQPSNEQADADDVSKRLPDIVQNEVGSYLVELIISLASEDQLRQLYDQLFKDNLMYFAVHPIANYVLQKLLSVIVDPVMLKELLNDITQYLEDILAVRHVGIVTKLAEACKNTGSGQGEFKEALLTAFHCQEPVERQIKIVPLIASLQTYDVFFNEQDPDKETEQEVSNMNVLKTVNIHGSLLLQQLLQFTKPKLIVSSVLDLSPAELMCLCCDKCGSHVVDAFFQSSTVLDTNKFAFLKKLEGLYTNIACNRNGSRCLESIWKGSALKSRILIAEQLSKNQDRIEGDQWGRFLYRNFALFKFSQRRKEWMDIQGASTKKQQLLNDILQGNAKRKSGGKQSEAITPNIELIAPTSFTDGGSKLNKKKGHNKESLTDDDSSGSKLNKKKRHHQEVAVGISDIPEQISEGGKQKKKTKLTDKIKTELEDEAEQISEGGKQKKRAKLTDKIKTELEDEAEQISEGGKQKKRAKLMDKIKTELEDEDEQISEGGKQKKRAKLMDKIKTELEDEDEQISEGGKQKKRAKLMDKIKTELEDEDEQISEGGKQKKRAKLTDEIKTELEDEDEQISEGGKQKKRAKLMDKIKTELEDEQISEGGKQKKKAKLMDEIKTELEDEDEQISEGGKQKKKAKLTDEIKTELEDEEDNETENDSSKKKKRKRNKQKKRVVRHVESDEFSHENNFSSENATLKKKKKK